VLLYELLTGSTPLSHKRVKEAVFLVVLRLIREEEPRKPSTPRAQRAEAKRSRPPKRGQDLLHSEVLSPFRGPAARLQRLQPWAAERAKVGTGPSATGARTELAQHDITQPSHVPLGGEPLDPLSAQQRPVFVPVRFEETPSGGPLLEARSSLV